MATNSACPVCGMAVDADNPVATATAGGQTFAFCSEECRDAFLANPGAYAGSDRA